MRVVFVNPVAILGGAERVLLNLLRSLPVALPGVDRRLVLGADGPLVEEARQAGVGVHLVPMPDAMAGVGTESAAALRSADLVRLGASSVRYRLALARTLATLAPDVVHSNGLKTHLLTTRATRAPVVWHLHDFLRDRGKLALPLRVAARVGATAAIANSEAVARDARALFPRLPIHVVHNAVDTEHHRPGAPAVDPLLPSPPGAVRVGLVATYARWKGHLLFLDAAARLAPSDPRLHFYVVGGPVYATAGSQFSLDELEREVASRNLYGRVTFVPFQRDPADVYRALDVVVHASTRREPFGMTIVEAMANGRPVIVSREGGAAELFTDGVDALGFAPGNTAELARAIERLASDARLRSALGAAARETAVNRYALPRFASEIARIYRQIASES